MKRPGPPCKENMHYHRSQWAEICVDGEARHICCCGKIRFLARTVIKGKVVYDNLYSAALPVLQAPGKTMLGSLPLLWLCPLRDRKTHVRLPTVIHDLTYESISFCLAYTILKVSRTSGSNADVWRLCMVLFTR